MRDPDRKRDSDAAFRERNRAGLREYAARWRDEHRESLRAYQRTWRDEHRERLNSRAAEYRRRWVAKNPLGPRNAQLKCRYGFSQHGYAAMLARQGGKCAICSSEKPGHGLKWFHVDHDHSTGRIRALLCAGCNKGLGQFHDDPALLRMAADYLERHVFVAAVCAPTSRARRPAQLGLPF